MTIAHIKETPVQKDLEYFQKLLLKRFSELQRQAISEGTASPTEAERQRINLALDRIRRSDYWNCVNCGGKITEERLMNDPTVLTCAVCTSEKKKLDRHHLSRLRPELGTPNR